MHFSGFFWKSEKRRKFAFFRFPMISGSGEFLLGIVEDWAKVSTSFSFEVEAGFEVEAVAETTSSLLKKTVGHYSSQVCHAPVSFCSYYYWS